MNLVAFGVIFKPVFRSIWSLVINIVTLFVIFGDIEFNNPPAYCFPVYCK